MVEGLIKGGVIQLDVAATLTAEQWAEVEAEAMRRAHADGRFPALLDEIAADPDIHVGHCGSYG